jgi:hypothetical protein
MGHPHSLPVGFFFELVFVFAAMVEDLAAELSYSLARSFAYLGRAFTGADPDVLAGSGSAFAEIGSGVAGVQSSGVADRSGSAFAEAGRALGCAFADVLTALADVVAGGGRSFLVLIVRGGLRLGCSLILLRICGPRGGGQAQQNTHARCHKNRGELESCFHVFSPASRFKMTITSHACLMLLSRRPVAAEACCASCAIFLNAKGLSVAGRFFFANPY